MALSLLDVTKFRDPRRTADGAARASVSPRAIRTLWFNTGTLCNLTCRNCYIESSPENDRLVYLSTAEVAAYLDEARSERLPVEEIGFTGGEPFMNPEFPGMLCASLDAGFRVLVLTNAMKPMTKARAALLALSKTDRERLMLRVSLDHYSQAGHEQERGRRSWKPTLEGLEWLSANGFRVSVAGRTFSGEAEAEARAGYARLFAQLGLAVDAEDPAALVLFPEMDARLDVPEITTACWDILGVRPDDLMCASSRMIVKRRGADRPVVVPCTLLPYDLRFELGTSLAVAARAEIPLNHPHCASFCVLGGASCS